MWWKKPKPAAPQAPGERQQATVPEAPSAWRAGFAHHQAGRLAEAEALYRETLAQHPDHFDARHLLGVIALQRGQHEAARTEITRALSSQPGNAAALGNLGTALMGLGVARLTSGDASAAAREFQALLHIQPDNAAAHCNLALALERTGQDEQALHAYDRALALQPGMDAALGNRGALLARLGRYSQARDCLREAVERQPGSATLLANLGAVYRDTGELVLAEQVLRKAVAQDSGLRQARLNLAVTLLELGQETEASRIAASLCQEHPASADAHALQGQVALALRQLEKAEQALRQALVLDPELGEAHHNLGLVRMMQGDAAQAHECHQRAVQSDPANAAARWAQAMTRVPAILDDAAHAAPSRQAMESELQALDRWFDASRSAQGFRAVGSTQPFYLAYQPGNHKSLLMRYGRLCERLMREWQAAQPPQRAPARTGTRIRLGVVSAHIRDHSVWNAITQGWLEQLDPQRFEIHLFKLDGAADARTAQAGSLATRMESGPASLAEWVRRINGSAPDILLYPEIGMDAMTVKLASLRLAPLQLATWGHPQTTGLPTIDCYVSAQALEPPDAQANYSEQLVCLPGLGVHYSPLEVSPEPVDREALGLRPDAALLLCPGLPFKYFPSDDGVWVDIAKQLPQAQLVFFNASTDYLSSRLEARLRQCFLQAGLRFEHHVRFVPRLDRPQFFGLMQQACLFLDSIGFSGFNTAMQAMECGLPVVTLEGPSLRGRFAAGILREIGLEESIARTHEDYVRIAVALASDATRRQALQDHILQRRARLFATQAPVKALADFLGSKLAQVRIRTD
jgi:predicted O-linked N-acetylglucosamine transferase (SPINDLY family)